MSSSKKHQSKRDKAKASTSTKNYTKKKDSSSDGVPSETSTEGFQLSREEAEVSEDKENYGNKAGSSKPEDDVETCEEEYNPTSPTCNPTSPTCNPTGPPYSPSGSVYGLASPTYSVSYASPPHYEVSPPFSPSQSNPYNRSLTPFAVRRVRERYNYLGEMEPLTPRPLEYAPSLNWSPTRSDGFRSPGQQSPTPSYYDPELPNVPPQSPFPSPFSGYSPASPSYCQPLGYYPRSPVILRYPANPNKALVYCTLSSSPYKSSPPPIYSPPSTYSLPSPARRRTSPIYSAASNHSPRSILSITNHDRLSPSHFPPLLYNSPPLYISRLPTPPSPTNRFQSPPHPSVVSNYSPTSPKVSPKSSTSSSNSTPSPDRSN